MNEIMSFTISKDKIDSFKQKSLPLLSNKKEDFIQYANFCQLRSFNQKFIQTTMEAALKSAEELLYLLKTEYYLK